jgi:hypothetical protein
MRPTRPGPRAPRFRKFGENGWGKNPICIPDAMEVKDKWFIQMLDPEAADYGRWVVENKAKALKVALDK